MVNIMTSWSLVTLHLMILLCGKALVRVLSDLHRRVLWKIWVWRDFHPRRESGKVLGKHMRFGNMDGECETHPRPAPISCLS